MKQRALIAAVGVLCAWSAVGCGSDADQPTGNAGSAGSGAGAGGAGSSQGGSGGAQAGAKAQAGNPSAGAAGADAAGAAGDGDAGTSGTGADAGDGGSAVGVGGAAGAGGGSSDPLFDPNVTLTETQLPDARVNQAYAGTLHGSGGSGLGFVFTLAEGQLPPGITLGSSGTLGGQSSSDSTATFKVRVTDSLGHWNTVQLSLRVARHRWLLYTASSATGGVVVPTLHTSLFDSSTSSSSELPAACTSTPSFSPDGKWLACGPLFDARDASFGAALALGCTVRAWSPDQNEVSCGDATHTGFVDLRNPTSIASFSIGSGCTVEKWSPGGALIGFSCLVGQTQTTYVASPRWAAPVAPLSIGAGQFMGFVSDSVVALKAPSGKVAYSRITGSTASAVTELSVTAYTDAVTGLTFRSNPVAQRAAFKVDALNEAIYDFSSAQLVIPSAPSAGIPQDLSHFIAKDGSNPYQVFSTSQPATAVTAFPALTGFAWSPDSKILIGDSGPAHAFQATWFTPTVHSVPMAADVGLYQSLASPPGVSVLFDPASEFVIYGAQGQFDLIHFDAAATNLPNTTGGGGNALEVPAISISPSRRGFAQHGCVVGLTNIYAFSGGDCAPQRPAAIPGLIGDPNSPLLPLNRWSSDSSVMFFVYTASGGSPAATAYGLAAVPIADPLHPFDLVVPTVGLHGPLTSTTSFSVQP